MVLKIHIVFWSCAAAAEAAATYPAHGQPAQNICGTEANVNIYPNNVLAHITYTVYSLILGVFGVRSIYGSLHSCEMCAIFLSIYVRRRRLASLFHDASRQPGTHYTDLNRIVNFNISIFFVVKHALKWEYTRRGKINTLHERRRCDWSACLIHSTSMWECRMVCVCSVRVYVYSSVSYVQIVGRITFALGAYVRFVWMFLYPHGFSMAARVQGKRKRIAKREQESERESAIELSNEISAVIPSLQQTIITFARCCAAFRASSEHKCFCHLF